MAIKKPGHWFNKNIYYLGDLCKNYHQWGTSNFSLRNLKTKECVCCNNAPIKIGDNYLKKREEKKKAKLPKSKCPSKIELFNKQIDKSGNCWEWTGKKNKAGYGLFIYDKLKLAHRVSYLLAYGEFDRKLFVCHKCDNPSCVNPQHLFLGSAKDNFQDMISKGRHKIAALMIANKKAA